ncbi:hypothetical protein GBA52_028150 [Prunus armeniaca]|nr:hypothetical protein GBA52_028150 [Prunus armeniaca]
MGACSLSLSQTLAMSLSNLHQLIHVVSLQPSTPPIVGELAGDLYLSCQFQFSTPTFYTNFFTSIMSTLLIGPYLFISSDF